MNHVQAPLPQTRPVDPGAADRAAFLDLLQQGFDRAVDAAGAVTHTVAVAGTAVRLSFAGHALVPHILPALAHLQTDAALPPALTLCLWDSASTGTPLPLLANSLVELLRSRWYEQLEMRREVKGYNDGRIRTVFHLGPDILSVLDLERGLGVYWIQDAADIPYYERGYPLTALLSWWIESQGCQLVHAAAVGYPWGGALLPGKGGSGKSTTTLACLDSDLGILGDDYCVLARRPAPRMVSLFNTSKLKGPEDVARFAQHRGMISNLAKLDSEKSLIFLHEHAPDRLLAECPLRVILLPRVTGQVDTVLRPASAGAALRFLAPSTMFQLPGDATHAFQEAVAVIRQLPVFELGLGTDLRQIPTAISQALRDVTSGG